MPATSWSMLFQGRRAAHTLLLILGIGVPGTGLFIVATILPSVVADLGGAAFYTWSTVLYTVAAILGTASGRFIRATLGFRPGYLTGALVFLGGAVGCALAPHMLVLVGARHPGLGWRRAHWFILRHCQRPLPGGPAAAGALEPQRCVGPGNAPGAPGRRGVRRDRVVARRILGDPPRADAGHGLGLAVAPLRYPRGAAAARPSAPTRPPRDWGAVRGREWAGGLCGDASCAHRQCRHLGGAGARLRRLRRPPAVSLAAAGADDPSGDRFLDRVSLWRDIEPGPGLPAVGGANPAWRLAAGGRVLQRVAVHGLGRSPPYVQPAYKVAACVSRPCSGPWRCWVGWWARRPWSSRGRWSCWGVLQH